VTARVAQAAVAAAAFHAVSVSAGEIMDVDAELAAMRREVAALRRASDESWADGVRAEQVRAVVRDVLSDASTRTAWRGGGAESLRVGYEPGLGFVMGDPAGGEMIRAFGFVQTRFVWNSGYDAPERTPAADDVWGMEVRRAQLFVTGNVGGPDLTWLIGLAIGSYTDPESLQALQVDPDAVIGTPLQISYLNITKQLGDGWFVQAGSIFTPFTYESHLFSTAQTQMGECSFIEWLFTASFTTGVNLGWSGESVRWQLCYGNQVGTAPTPWDSTSNQSIAMTSRLNWKLCGEWSQYDLETSFPGQPFGAFIGLAGLYQNGRGINPPALNGANQRAVTADAALMFGGANLILQGIWADQWVDRDSTSWGALAQGGVFLSGDVEAFASFGIADVGGTISTVSAGANWYIDREALKLTARVVVPVVGNPTGVAAEVLPPQGLGGGPDPNNNASLIVQLQAAF
jgi:hypothetical protein